MIAFAAALLSLLAATHADTNAVSANHNIPSAPAPAPWLDRQDDIIEQLFEWGHQNYVRSNITVGTFVVDNGIARQQVRGAKALEDISQGELMMGVPREILITPASIAARWPTLFAQKPLRDIVAQMRTTKNVALLAYAIWIERTAGALGDNRAKWRDVSATDMSLFFRTLPPHAKQVELSSDEMEMLQCHNKDWCNVISTYTKNSIAYIEQSYEIISGAFQGASEDLREFLPPFMEFVEVYTVVNSRCFVFEGLDEGEAKTEGKGKEKGKYRTIGLVPTGDFFNHHSHVHAVSNFRYNPAALQFEFYADQDFKRGEQVFIRYGRLPNAEMVHHYGFVMPDNAYESVTAHVYAMAHAPLKTMVSSALAKIKVEVLTGLLDFSGEESEEIFIGVDGVPSDAAMLGLRIRALTDSDMYTTGQGGESPMEMMHNLIAAHAAWKAKEEDAVLKNKLAAAESAIIKATHFGLTNELTVWKAWVKWTKSRLTKTGTRLKEDMAMVKKLRQQHDADGVHDSVERKWLYLVQRVEEKRVLHRAMLHGIKRIADAYRRYVTCPDASESEDADTLVLARECDQWLASMDTWETAWQGWLAGLEHMWSKTAE